jgi:predicted MFS family arabinose efflux permease
MSSSNIFRGLINPFFSFLKDTYRGIPLTVWQLALTNLINRAGTMVLPFLTIYLVQELDYSPSFAGLIIGSYGVGALIGTWAGGSLSDRIGAFQIALFPPLFCGLCMFALEHLYTEVQILIGVTLLGISGEANRPALSVLLVNSCSPKEQPRGFSLLRLASNLGRSIGPAIGGFLALRSYDWLFRLDGLTCMIAVLPLIISQSQGLLITPEVDRGDFTEESNSRPWWKTKLLFFFVVVVVSGMMLLQVWSTYPVFLEREYNLSNNELGLLMSMSAALLLIFEMPATYFCSTWKPLHVISFGIVLIGLGLGILPMGKSFMFAIFSLALWSCGEMLSSPFMSTYVAELAPKERLGSYMGAHNMAFSIAFILGPILGGWIYDYLGPNLLWFSVAGSGIGCVIICQCLQQWKS